MHVGDLVLITMFFSGLWCGMRQIVEGLDKDAPRLVPYAPMRPTDARRSTDLLLKRDILNGELKTKPGRIIAA